MRRYRARREGEYMLEYRGEKENICEDIEERRRIYERI